MKATVTSTRPVLKVRVSVVRPVPATVTKSTTQVPASYDS